MFFAVILGLVFTAQNVTGSRPIVTLGSYAHVKYKDARVVDFSEAAKDSMLSDMLSYWDITTYTQDGGGGDSRDRDRDRDEDEITLLESKELPPPPDPFEKVQAILDAVGGIVDPIVTPAIDSAAGPITDIVSDTMGEMIETLGTPSMSVGVQFNMASELPPCLEKEVTASLMPALLEGLADACTEGISQDVGQKISKILVTTIPPKVKNEVVIPVVSGAVDNIMGNTPTKTVNLLTYPLISILSRSLIQAIVPALSQTVTHNPLQDYYCFYCFKFKAYCQYCNYAPQQLYYQQYYAGFYSSYYAQYYDNEYTGIAREVRERASDPYNFEP